MARDWLSTLWDASYMGVPFFFEEDAEEGGRGLKIHEFPNRDDPYIEDLGEKPRTFDGNAYVSGDDADTQAIDFAATLATRGPGTLVVPIFGPVQVHCEHFKRQSKRDQLGYICFEVKFVRAGAALAIVSVPLLGQQVFDAGDAMASVLANLFPAVLALSNPADYVIAAAIDAVEGVAAAVELLRVSGSVNPPISARVAAANAAIVNAAPLLIAYGDPADAGDAANLLADGPPLDETFTDPVTALAATVIATIRLLGDGMAASPDAGAGALLSLALSYPAPPIDTTLSPNAAAAAANTAAITALARVAALSAWCEALERQTYASRPDGVAARAAAAERLGQELAQWTGAANYPIYVALQELQGAVVQYLTQLIADLAPIVTVSAPQAMPALWWAWRLYGDPARAVDLTLRNQVRHPSFMPLSFAALAPGFTAPGTLPANWPAP